MFLNGCFWIRVQINVANCLWCKINDIEFKIHCSRQSYHCHYQIHAHNFDVKIKSFTTSLLATWKHLRHSENLKKEWEAHLQDMFLLLKFYDLLISRRICFKKVYTEIAYCLHKQQGYLEIVYCFSDVLCMLNLGKCIQLLFWDFT